MKTYKVNEVFLTVQGEGIRAGTANVFVRFSGCNLECRKEPGPKSPGGFDCDTEFVSGRKLTLDELVAWIIDVSNGVRWIVATGGEPGLQLDADFIGKLHEHGFKIAVETNGSVELPSNIDWITVSPKVAEHAIRQKFANEVKYVRGLGQAIPRTVVEAEHKLLSPAFSGLEVEQRVVDWCIGLVLVNPEWRLSMQQHKAWKVR